MNSADLKKRLQKKGSIELHNALQNKQDYSEDAYRLIQEIVEERGGIQKLKANILLEQKELDKENSEEDKRNVFRQLIQDQLKYNPNLDVSETFERFKDIDIPLEEKKQIFEEEAISWDAEVKDKKITFASLTGGLIGGFIGSIVGGVFFGITLIFTQRIFLLFIFGLGVISFFFIWLFSRKSSKNMATIIITLLSTFGALILGWFLFELIGPITY